MVSRLMTHRLQVRLTTKCTTAPNFTYQTNTKGSDRCKPMVDQSTRYQLQMVLLSTENTTYISSHYVQKTVSCFSFFYFFLFFLTLLYFWFVTASNSLLTVLIIIKYNKMFVEKYAIYTLSLVLFVYLNAFHIKPLL